jgi:hypothetical protein
MNDLIVRRWRSAATPPSPEDARIVGGRATQKARLAASCRTRLDDRYFSSQSIDLNSRIRPKVVGGMVCITQQYQYVVLLESMYNNYH